MSELRPWQGGESMLEAVRRIASDRSVGDDLPDEPPRDPSKLSWSAGSWDGVATHHADLGDEPQGRTDEIYARLVALAEHDRDPDRIAVYRLAQESDTLQYLDPVLERILLEPGLRPRLAPHARWLLAVARHRGPTKLGIACSACAEMSTTSSSSSRLRRTMSSRSTALWRSRT